jgi:two-component system, NarL family, sensor histidine kinase UhpB
MGSGTISRTSPAAPAGRRERARPQPRRHSLFRRLFVLDSGVLVAAAVLLAATPATISFPVTARQATELAAGIGAMLLANAVVLRSALRPLEELATAMGRVDVLVPGERLAERGSEEVRVLGAAFNAMLDRLEDERREATSRAVGRDEEERRRLAHELHDEIGQRLTAELLALRAVVEHAPPALVPRLEEIQELARTNLDEVRRIARHLRPALLDDLGLAYAVHGLLDLVEETAPLTVGRAIDEALPQLAPDVDLVVYRVAQEAVTNVLRHAAATTVHVALEAHERSVTLDVVDDGRGMLYQTAVESGGIRGMRERAVVVGGVLTVVSSPGGGTRVSLTVPIE